MADPFVGEIKMFAGNFAPRSYASCDGQLLAISQNDALFSLLGTTYGGDGMTTFALPDLRGRVPVHAGSGPGLSPRSLGNKGGQETVALSVSQTPSHGHGPLRASADVADSPAPVGLVGGSAFVDAYTDAAATVSMAPQAVASVGGNQPHDNMMPFRCIQFIIALFGIYPSRS